MYDDDDDDDEYSTQCMFNTCFPGRLHLQSTWCLWWGWSSMQLHLAWDTSGWSSLPLEHLGIPNFMIYCIYSLLIYDLWLLPLSGSEWAAVLAPSYWHRLKQAAKIYHFTIVIKYKPDWHFYTRVNEDWSSDILQGWVSVHENKGIFLKSC